MAEEVRVGSTFAGYRIESVLGRGGMGVVYRAEQPELDRRVALKVIAPQLANDPAFRERFKRESRLAAAIEHANAIPIYEAGVAGDDILYLAMRYVEGTDFGSLIAREGPLDPRRAAAVVDQVAGALDEAHAIGLVHRDIKPANILIASRRGREHAYLTDFGLTKQASGATGGLTATGQWVGTIDYVSPEQVSGARVDARADVYALGCVLFAALTGRPPFERDTDIAKLFAHANDPAPRPREARPELPAEIDEVVERALAKDPDRRYPSAGDLGRAAIAAAAGVPVAAPERTVAVGQAAPGATVPAAEATAAAATAAAGPAASTRLAAPPDDAAPSGSRRRRRWRAAVAGTTVVAAAAIAVLLATGTIGGGEEEPAPSAGDRGTAAGGERTDGGGGDGGGGGGGREEGGGGGRAASAFEFTRLNTGAFSVEVPADWQVTQTEEAVDAVGTRLRTEVLNPSGESRVAVNRRPADSQSPQDQREDAEAMASTEAGFDLTDTREVRVGGERAAVMEFKIDDEDLGPARAVAFFIAGSNGAYRIQATAARGDPSLANDLAVARHAAETLETR